MPSCPKAPGAPCSPGLQHQLRGVSQLPGCAQKLLPEHSPHSSALCPPLPRSNQVKTSAAVPVKKTTQRLGWALGTSSCGSTAVISAAFSSCLHSRPPPWTQIPAPHTLHGPTSPSRPPPHFSLSKCLDSWSTLGSAS